MHTTIRAWTAPFEKLETFVPTEGLVLEIGCGHGLVATFLALSSTKRRVLGIDIDSQKIALATETARRLSPGEASLSFEVRESGDLPANDHGWDAIVFADVLYLIRPDDRFELLAKCAQSLSPGGVLVVKEVDTQPRFKARIAQIQEFLATRVLRITEGDNLDFPSAAELAEQLRAVGLAPAISRIDQGYFHPHCVVVGTKTAVS